MARGIDHIVLCGRDLDVMAASYSRLGFTLTPRAQHPFGTDNQLAQLNNNFIELLAVARPQDMTQATATHFSFGGYNENFVETGDGFSMLALKSQGWEEDRAHFEAAGLDLFEPFEFSRKAGQPDGTEVTVGFKLTIAKIPDFPDAVFFTCDHQHEAKYFYKPQFQTHPNTAVGMCEVMMTADDPAALIDLFKILIGPGAVNQYEDSLSIEADHTVITVTKRSQMSERFLGAELGPLTGTRFVGYGVTVADIEAVQKTLQAAGLNGQRRGNSIWLCGPETGQVIVEFSQPQVTVR